MVYSQVGGPLYQLVFDDCHSATLRDLDAGLFLRREGVDMNLAFNEDVPTSGLVRG